MRQLILNAKRELVWIDVPEPRLSTGLVDAGGGKDAIVRPIAVARCDADAGFIRHDGARILRVGCALHVLDPEVGAILGRAPFCRPYALGHEFVAEVVSVGEHVRNFSLGQRVVVPFQISCGSCPSCKRGETSTCETVPPWSMYGFGRSCGDWGGALSERVRVPYADGMLVPLPAGVSPEQIASADNLSDAWQRVAPALSLRPGGANVLVLGGGACSIGVYAAAIAKALGAGEVDYLDRHPERLALAAKGGANVVEGRLGTLSSKRYDVCVDATMKPSGLSHALRALKNHGICTSASIFFQRWVPVPLFTMYSRGLTLKSGLTNARAVIPHVLELITAKKLRPEVLTTRIGAFDDAHQVFLDKSTKVVVVR